MKFMNKKRFASAVMAGALTLSLAAPAFASNTTITGGYEEIPIAVVVPQTGTASINPYGLPVSVTLSTDKTVDLVGQQITTQPLSIKNQSKSKLDVNATLAVVPKGDVSIVTALDNTTVGKEIAVNLEVAPLDDAAYALSSENEKLNDLLITAFADSNTWAGAATLAAPVANKGDTADDITAASTNGTPLVQLGAATVNGDTITYGNNSIALFRLNGELNAEPNDGASPAVDTPWATDDGFEAKVVFKFSPSPYVAASVTLDKTSAAPASGGTETVTATFAAGDSGLTVTSWAWSSSDPTVCAATGTSATGTLVHVGSGTATVTCTATLSDGGTVTATCSVTCA